MKYFSDLRPHPNVVQVLGVSVNGTYPAIVMEFCPGGSLDKFLANKELSVKEQYKLIKGIAAGMLHLHSSNIIHRDLAARNVLVRFLFSSYLNGNSSRWKVVYMWITRIWLLTFSEIWNKQIGQGDVPKISVTFQITLDKYHKFFIFINVWRNGKYWFELLFQILRILECHEWWHLEKMFNIPKIQLVQSNGWYRKRITVVVNFHSLQQTNFKLFGFFIGHRLLSQLKIWHTVKWVMYGRLVSSVRTEIQI